MAPAAERVRQWRAHVRELLGQVRLLRSTAKVQEVQGGLVVTSPLQASPGEEVAVRGGSGLWYAAVVLEAGTQRCKMMMLDAAADVAPGVTVEALGRPLQVPVGPQVLSRVLDPLGRPMDGGRALAGPYRAVTGQAPEPVDRRSPRLALWTGVRAVDGFVTCARGQRMGILGPPGTGKTRLLRMIAKGAQADVAVFALVGERGREIMETADEVLGTRRSAVVVATAPGSSAALRRLTAFSATAIAEYFRDQGADVVLCVDSLTRLAHAQREIGLSLGEMPAVRAYPPSVFSLVPELVERAGPARRGSITAFYALLLESEQLAEPVCDVALASLDGHVLLSRDLANAGVYPPVDILLSLSRLMRDVVDGEHLEWAGYVRRVLQAREERKDLIETGLYRPGSHRETDAGQRLLPAVHDFLRQAPEERVDPAEVRRTLAGLAGNERPLTNWGRGGE